MARTHPSLDDFPFFNLAHAKWVASVLSMLSFVMFLLSDFFGVCDVTWISHQLIDGSQRCAGRMFQAGNFLGFC